MTYRLDRVLNGINNLLLCWHCILRRCSDFRLDAGSWYNDGLLLGRSWLSWGRRHRKLLLFDALLLLGFDEGLDSQAERLVRYAGRCIERGMCANGASITGSRLAWAIENQYNAFEGFDSLEDTYTQRIWIGRSREA